MATSATILKVVQGRRSERNRIALIQRTVVLFRLLLIEVTGQAIVEKVIGKAAQHDRVAGDHVGVQVTGGGCLISICSTTAIVHRRRRIAVLNVQPMIGGPGGQRQIGGNGANDKLVLVHMTAGGLHHHSLCFDVTGTHSLFRHHHHQRDWTLKSDDCENDHFWRRQNCWEKLLRLLNKEERVIDLVDDRCWTAAGDAAGGGEESGRGGVANNIIIVIPIETFF
ncbi:hypothetical protein TYRP_001743 [Tyrophagus putrescentiae]|nr:hypothetical protein TYRP_001743 [Tyrophagus putrescentiae]